MNGMDGDRGSSQLQSETSRDPLAEGDAAAATGRWPQAVEAWQRALTTPSRTDAMERLSWFVAWRSGDGSARVDMRHVPASARAALSLTAASGLLATAFVFIADGAAGSWRAGLVTAAWILYAAAAVLSLIYAARTGPRRSSAAAQWNRRDTARLCAEAVALAQPDVAPTPVRPQQELGSQGSGP